MPINNPILFIGQAFRGGTSGSIPFVNQFTQIAQNNSNLFWDQNSNRLGIGINSPLGSLDVYNGTAFFRNGSAGSTNVGGELRFSTIGNADTVGGAAIKSLNQFSGESNGQDAHLAFYTNQRTGSNTYTGLTEKMRITANGRFGVGTTSPSSRCNIVTSTQYDGITLGNGTYTAVAIIGYSASNDEGGILLSQTGSTKVQLLANGSSYINGGNLGIGTSSPLAKLSVGAGSLTDSNVPIQASSSGIGTAGFFGFNKNGAYGVLVGYDQGTVVTGGCIRQVNTDGLYFIVNNTTIAQSILAAGNIGIGTSSPDSSAQFQIDSTSRGVLPPRMTQTQRNAIASPATGLTVYDTTNSCLFVYDSVRWCRQSTSERKVVGIGSAQSGTTMTVAGVSFRYSSNATGGNLDVKSDNGVRRSMWYSSHKMTFAGTLVNPVSSQFFAEIATWTTVNVGNLNSTDTVWFQVYDQDTQQLWRVHLTNEVDVLIFLHVEAC